MGDSDESIFCWDEKEEDFGAGVYTSQDFQTNCFETTNQTIYDEDSSISKRIRLSPDSDHQEGDEDSSSQSSPLGLTLSKTPSFLNLLQRSLSKGKQTDLSTSEAHDDDKPTRKMDEYLVSQSQSNSEKLKASNFPAFFIKIGSWQRITRHEGDLTAKMYYAKRKLVWEILDGALKSKIEIQWSDISAIRAITPDNEPGSLEIELNKPPLFYREINPQPRKHTLWQQSSDFTGGQAPVWRTHYVRFLPGVLDKHYEKLLQCDERLFALSQKPFPSHGSPYFDPNMFGISQLSLIFNNYGSNYQNPYHAPSLTQLPISTMLPVTDFVPSPNHGATSSWPHHHYQPNVGLINDIQPRFLGESHAASSNEAICSLLDPSNVHHYYSTDQVSHSTTDFINPSIAQPHYWMPHHNYSNNYDNTQLMEQQMSNNSSLSPFLLPDKNPTSTGDHFF